MLIELVYYHDKLNEIWGTKTISLKSGGAWPFWFCHLCLQLNVSPHAIGEAKSLLLQSADGFDCTHCSSTLLAECLTAYLHICTHGHCISLLFIAVLSIIHVRLVLHVMLHYNWPASKWINRLKSGSAVVNWAVTYTCICTELDVYNENLEWGT